MNGSSGARERKAVYAAVVLLVLFRSLLFTFTELSYDSDQAVIGLMAKHLAHGRAFPLFMYGQNYMLGIEAWMAAPMFLMFGVSVAALKLPILLVNLAVALLLVRLLERDCGLRPRDAFCSGSGAQSARSRGTVPSSVSMSSSIETILPVRRLRSRIRLSFTAIRTNHV